MARLILWIVLFIVIGRLVWRFARAVFEGAGMLRDPEAAQPEAVKLVRDPVCGVFVVPTKALTSGSGTATRYFCSENCRQEWSRR